MIYLDNAATTKMSEIAIQTLIEISTKQYGNASSMYNFGKKSKELLEKARKIIANCIGAEPEEIYFTSCGTESNNWVIKQIEKEFERFITTKIEHHAILYPAKMYCDNVIYLPVDKNCMIKDECLDHILDGKKSIVSIMLQNNETGAIQNIKELAEKVHKDNPDSIFHTDAVQAVGHMNLNVKNLGVDMLSASAHKFNGPKGIGFLYVNKKCNINPVILGGGQENGMRSGTENLASIFSMAMALEDNLKNLNSIHNRIDKLEKELFSLLKKNGINYRINGNDVNRAKGIINLALEEIDGEGLWNILDMNDICISIGSACNSKSQERSHVLSAMGIDNETIDSSVRISIGRYNTEEEIHELVKCISQYKKIVVFSNSER